MVCRQLTGDDRGKNWMRPLQTQGRRFSIGRERRPVPWHQSWEQDSPGLPWHHTLIGSDESRLGQLLDTAITGYSWCLFDGARRDSALDSRRCPTNQESRCTHHHIRTGHYGRLSDDEQLPRVNDIPLAPPGPGLIARTWLTPIWLNWNCSAAPAM